MLDGRLHLKTSETLGLVKHASLEVGLHELVYATSRCVVLSKLLNLSFPQFPQL